MMKKIIFAFTTILLIAQQLSAQIVNSTATLNSVTVYSNGAELNHTAKANLPAGNCEVIIKNVSGAVDENSIQVGSNTDLTIMSVSFVREFLSGDNQSAEFTKLQDSFRVANNDLEIIRGQISTQTNALSILDANKIVRGENTGLQVTELQKMVDYYINKHKEIMIAVQALRQKETKQAELVTRIQNQINERNASRDSGKGEIRLQVLNGAANSTTFTVSYVTYTAAWSPMYDLKTKDAKSPLKIIYKGNIVQNTGLDWKKVKLSLSTSNPSQSGTMPILSTWFLNYYTPAYGQNSYGYNQAKSAQATTMMNTVQSIGNANSADKEMAAESTVGAFTTTTETALNAVFDIDLAYDIPSDNKAHSVAMKEYDVPAIYKYYSVPKMDKEAFLVAEIADWESLNLVAGPANIIFDGTYVGKSFIDPNSTQDTLNISLGRDKKLIVKREKVQDYCSSKLIGTNKLHTVTYEIKVKNTRKESIQLLLKDQLPISSQKDIEVEVLEISDAMRNEETGVLTWKLNVAPNETKTVRIQYSVKFPKDKLIGNLK
jgi:uncharacterized protein (TIGR02231 family)